MQEEEFQNLKQGVEKLLSRVIDLSDKFNQIEKDLKELERQMVSSWIIDRINEQYLLKKDFGKFKEDVSIRFEELKNIVKQFEEKQQRRDRLRG